MSQLFAKALTAINKHGILLVYPIKNKKEPASIWSALYPRSEMVWEWDEGADNRVSQLWYLREKLSISEKVVYAKWFQGRATFFSIEVFVNMLAYLKPETPFSSMSREIHDVLLSDSPISTKQIKQAVDLQGRSFEGMYNKAMKELWNHLYIVAFGEVHDSSFPSLAVGATELIFEEFWRESKTIPRDKAEAFLLKKLGDKNLFMKFAQKVRASKK